LHGRLIQRPPVLRESFPINASDRMACGECFAFTRDATAPVDHGAEDVKHQHLNLGRLHIRSPSIFVVFETILAQGATRNDEIERTRKLNWQNASHADNVDGYRGSYKVTMRELTPPLARPSLEAIREFKVMPTGA